MDSVANRDQSADTIQHILKNLFGSSGFPEADHGPAFLVLADGGGLYDADLVGAVVIHQESTAVVEAEKPHGVGGVVENFGTEPALDGSLGRERKPFLRFGGLTPESHQKLIEFYYPRLKRVAFGPPIINIEKLLALQRAGLLDFSAARNPRVLSDETSGCFELRCDEFSGAAKVLAEVLVDARYPATDIPRDATPLYRNLHRRGMVRAYENRSQIQDEFAYRPGAIDMTEGARFVVDIKGVVNQDIAVIGIPTEGNLVGNLTMARDEYAGIWAAEVIKQLRYCESVLYQKSPATE